MESPLELTSFARQKPFEYFKYEVEWMVHNRIDPAFNRHDEVYEFSHRKLDDEFRGQVESRFKSSVWKSEFNSALEGRPDCYILKIPAMLEEKCAACNRSGHPPSFKVTFSGQRYDRQSLDPISKEDNDSDSDGDDLEQESAEQEEEDVFLVGKHCCQNAEIAHSLYHWRYQLNDFVRVCLAEEGYLSARKIVDRERWTNKKKEKLANRICDGMVEDGQMKELYRQFKGSLAAARDFKVREVILFSTDEIADVFKV